MQRNNRDLSTLSLSSHCLARDSPIAAANPSERIATRSPSNTRFSSKQTKQESFQGSLRLRLRAFRRWARDCDSTGSIAASRNRLGRSRLRCNTRGCNTLDAAWRRRHVAALRTLGALMFSGFLFSLSLETDPPGLNVLSHGRHAARSLREKRTGAPLRAASKKLRFVAIGMHEKCGYHPLLTPSVKVA